MMMAIFWAVGAMVLVPVFAGILGMTGVAWEVLDRFAETRRGFGWSVLIMLGYVVLGAVMAVAGALSVGAVLAMADKIKGQ